MAKSKTLRLTGAASDLVDVICIGARTIKSQALKVETITDLFTDGLVEATTAFDGSMRNYAKQISAQAKL